MNTIPQQRNLFEAIADEQHESSGTGISGLVYFPNFIDPETHNALLAKIDQNPWLTDLSRRVQHYGYKYDYKARGIDLSMRIGELPSWVMDIADRFRIQGLWSEAPDQLIVNEYEPGQGIAQHVDCQQCFTGTIISLSLGSACVMDLINKETGEKKPQLLEPQSLLVMKEEARYNWTHGIAKRKSDRYDNRTIIRGRRVSLTFRKVILEK